MFKCDSSKHKCHGCPDADNRSDLKAFIAAGNIISINCKMPQTSHDIAMIAYVIYSEDRTNKNSSADPTGLQSRPETADTDLNV